MWVEIHSFETTVKGSVIQFHSISYATIAIRKHTFIDYYTTGWDRYSGLDLDPLQQAPGG